MTALAVAMLRWLWDRVRGRASGRLADVAPIFWIGIIAALIIGLVVLIWQPFRQTVPGGVMATAECGQLMADARNVALQRGAEQSREALASASVERARLERERRAALDRSRELEARLAEAEAASRLAADAAGKAVPACISVDLVRAWNKGADR